MKSHFSILLLAAACVASIIQADAFAQGTQSPGKGNSFVTPSEKDIRVRVDALLAQMTPEEKAGQLNILFALPIPQMMKGIDAKVLNGGTGALLFVTDPKETNRLQRIAVEQSRLKIPLLFGFDVIHGLTTIFPVPIGTAASWDPGSVERAEALAAREARAVGIHWTFGPMLDIARDPRWGRIVEGAGEDPYLASAMAAAHVRGLQGAAIGSPTHIIAGPKHFVGYGASLGGRDYDEVSLSDSELWNVYLPPFKAAIDAGAGNIMSAYMGLNGIPAAGNHWLLTDVLRKQWGFKGFVVSDNEGVSNLKVHGFAADDVQAAARALDAGVDMAMALVDPSYSRLPKAIEGGQVSAAQLDDAVRRILEMKLRMGLFENPYVDENRAAALLGSKANREVARITAERSAVLLRNEQNLLPLDRHAVRSIAVIGPLADAARDLLGPWVFNQNRPPMSSILAGVKEKVGPNVRVDFTPGVALPKRVNASPFATITGEVTRPEPQGGDSAGIAQAVTMARSADVAILVLGEGQDMSGETASRSTLDLPGRQQELLDAVVATGKPVVVLLVNGRPLDLKDSKASAILDIWYPGSEAGSAAANLLFGDATPGGKLPFTWPRNVGQVPMIYAHLTSHDPKNADKRYWNETNEPAWRFGHGLSYSTFAYTDVRLSAQTIKAGGSLTVSVDLTNTGKRIADEVAQLYIHQENGTAARPVRELKGFQRVTLKPGERRTLTFGLGPAELRYWNAARRDWTIDPARFDVAVGGSSAASFSARFSIEE
jgi:beta-glucosidase